jgi:mono/diheme cytochrome c family protein
MRRALLPLAVLIACAACNAKPHQFPLDFERMRDQPRYDPYAHSGFFDDGAAMRTPPGGTVAEEHAAMPAAVRTGRAGGEAVAEIPVPVSRAMLDRGRNRYDVFCSPCHGVDGLAESPVAENMQLRRPPSLASDRIRALPVGKIFSVVSEGYGLMPSYAHQLPVADRWAVVAYVRALQLSRGVPLDALPAPVRADAERALRAGGGR